MGDIKAGDRVRMSAIGRQVFPLVKNHKGVAISCVSPLDLCLRVLFDGRKSAQKFYCDFIELETSDD